MKPYHIAYIYKPCGVQRPAEREWRGYLTNLSTGMFQISRGVLLRILGGGVHPGSPNLEPTSDQKISFFTPLSDMASKIHTRFQNLVSKKSCYHYLDQNA